MFSVVISVNEETSGTRLKVMEKAQVNIYLLSRYPKEEGHWERESWETKLKSVPGMVRREMLSVFVS